MLPHPATGPRTKLSDPVVVGKDILELLSSAMYVDPLSIFREYIQNAADSLDEATELGPTRNGWEPAIHTVIDDPQSFGLQILLFPLRTSNSGFGHEPESAPLQRCC
jgi:hypothetical protein